jgi:hypothetical protein
MLRPVLAAGAQDRCFCGADAVTAQFNVKELRHRAGNPAQIEADTVFHRREIELFWHLDVYIHTTRQFVNLVF